MELAVLEEVWEGFLEETAVTPSIEHLPWTRPAHSTCLQQGHGDGSRVTETQGLTAEC